jgi:hypothetical protein
MFWGAPNNIIGVLTKTVARTLEITFVTEAIIVGARMKSIAIKL